MDNSQTTYIFLNFIDDYEALWLEFLNPKNANNTDLQIDALIAFLNEYKISGVIMEGIPIYVSKIM